MMINYKVGKERILKNFDPRSNGVHQKGWLVF